jgi:hypothetical protein
LRSVRSSAMSDTSSDTAKWSLCLTSRGQGRKIVQLSPSATTRELYQVAETQYGTSVAVSSLKYGFPPKLVQASDTQPIQEVLQNQERIQVEFGSAATSTAAKTKPETNIETTTGSSTITTTNTSRKSKRAASKRATENMPAVIQAQEKLLQQQQQPKSKRPRTTAAASPSTKRPTKPPAPKFTSSVGKGRRLADGATVASPPNTKGGRNKRANSSSRIISESSNKNKTSDMSEALLGALNDSGKMGQVLRKGMKNAVQASYETTRAFSRLAAIQAKKYALEIREEGGTASSSVLVISYQGSVDKTKTEEHVDCIPRDVLEAVLKGIHASNTEALRPENLALLSPRVLWSLAHIFPDHSSIPEMYQQLLPDLDWAFLRRRAQQLSEKALENMRQKQEVNGEEVNGEQAAEAIAAVEHAMEHLQDYTAAERQARQARAALNRLEGTTSSQDGEDGSAEWKLVTPTEPDRDELYQCIQGTNSTTKTDVPELITKLMRECNIHNWRELANVEDVKTLARKLDLPEEEVQPWIERAQEKSVDEIIVDICDDNVRAVELLTDKARSGTPKDLAVWRAIPQILYQRVVVGEEEDVPSLEQLRTWSQRAHQVLQECEWLNWYATPVE